MNKISLIILSLMAYGTVGWAQDNNASIAPSENEPVLPTAPYLLVNAPTFEMTIAQFREKYNAHHPDLPLHTFKVVKIPQDTPHLTRAASQITDYLYASTALEKGSEKIKSLQLTYLPDKIKQPENGTALQHAIAYMVAMAQVFDPTLSLEQAKKKVNEVLSHRQQTAFYQLTSGAVRYIVVDKKAAGLTFAIEPVKLVMAETPVDAQ